MKQIIVMISMIVLGISIYNFIMGPQDDSVVNVTGGVFRYQIQHQNTYP